jgi:hypothetical protein
VEPASGRSEQVTGASIAGLRCEYKVNPLGLDVLRCRSPQMVRKELAVFHVVYNLIRVLMRQAARVHDVDPQRLSFAGTRQRLLAGLPRGLATRGQPAYRRWLAGLLADIAADTLPERPGRHEPRAIKRRRKSFPYLVHPRHRARKTAHYDKR